MGGGARRVLIVLPAFNEEASIAAVLTEIRAAMPGIPFLVVDDGSTDSTASVAAVEGALVARLPFNLGVGGAMRFGFRYALDAGYDVVVQLDADGQHDPREIRALLDALDRGADVVIGARFAGVGDYRATGARRLAMRTLARMLSRTAGTTLTDVTSGFKANGPRAVALFAQQMPAEYLGDTIEALVIAVRAGCRIAQVPVAMRARSGGKPSQAPLRAALHLLRALSAFAFAYLRRAPQLARAVT